MTRRAGVIGIGSGLVVVGLVLVYNIGLVSLFHSPPFGDYRLSDPLTIEVSSHAVVNDDIELLRWSTRPEFISLPDDIRVQGVATGSESLFMGIGPADAVAGYLDGVAHDEITGWDSSADDIVDVVYATNDGIARPAAPAAQDFWVASVRGGGEQNLDWTIENGEWALVIMNADGSREVAADVRFGMVNPAVLLPIGSASLVVGIAALIGGGRLVVSVPARPGETPRWTLRGRSVLPTTVVGRVAVLCAVLGPIPYVSGALFGAPIFLYLAVRKGDRAVLLLLPLLVSIIPIGLIAIVAWALIFE